MITPTQEMVFKAVRKLCEENSPSDFPSANYEEIKSIVGFEPLNDLNTLTKMGLVSWLTAEQIQLVGK
jgi:hypothetical protein